MTFDATSVTSAAPFVANEFLVQFDANVWSSDFSAMANDFAALGLQVAKNMSSTVTLACCCCVSTTPASSQK